MTTANQVQTKHLPKRKGLDMLKGIAIIGIFLYHLIPSIFPGGFLGVPLFFVLSGYLMFTTSTSYLNTETFPVMDYYKKRIRRIIPPLFIMVMLVCCAMTLMKSRQMIGIREQILSIFLGYNNWWQIEQDASYFSHLTNASPFTHLWFLGVEMQFYLLWPLLFFLYKKLCRHAGAKHACFLFALLAILFVCRNAYALSSGQGSVQSLLRHRHYGLFLISRNVPRCAAVQLSKASYVETGTMRDSHSCRYACRYFPIIPAGIRKCTASLSRRHVSDQHFLCLCDPLF